jgi:hypothetical protein
LVGVWDKLKVYPHRLEKVKTLLHMKYREVGAFTHITHVLKKLFNISLVGPE